MYVVASSVRGYGKILKMTKTRWKFQEACIFGTFARQTASIDGIWGLRRVSTSMCLKTERAKFPSADFAPFLGKVYKPDDDSFLLVDAILQEEEFIRNILNPSTVLEIGMGSGVVITTVAKALKHTDCKFYATDINPNAIEATKKCAELNKIEGMELVLTNLADSLKDKLRNKVDLIVSNPPFEPETVEEIGVITVKSSWAAGPIGRAIVDKILPEIPQLLSKKGVFYMACIAENNIREIITIMASTGFKHKIVVEKRGTTSSTTNPTYLQYILRFSYTQYE